MFNTIVANETNIEPRRSIYPKKVNIKTIEISDEWIYENKGKFLPCTHKAAYINTEEGGRIVAIIHESIAKAILSGKKYYLWWDKESCGYLEILDFEFIE